jgi:hypothetical protein
MMRRIFGGNNAKSAKTPQIDAAPEASAWRPMTDTPAHARRTRPAAWIAYLDARAASLKALRAGDVATAAKRAEDSRRLHAAWRGYDYAPGPFTAPTSIQTPEPQLVGLSDPASVAIELATGIVGPSVDATDHAKRLIGVTIIDNLAWPWFEEWRGWFAERNSVPPMWDKVLLVDQPTPTQADDLFRDQLRELGVDERIALLYGGHAVELGLLAEDLCVTVDHARVIASTLATRGLAAYPATAAGRLARAMTVAQLKALAGTNGIAVKGQKDAIVGALIDHVDTEELERLAPGEFVDLVGAPATQWMGYRRAFIELWAHTMTMSGFKLREIQDATGLRDFIKGYSIIGDDECVFCRTKNKTRIALGKATPATLPPFHPGCRCATAPWGQWD